MLTFAGWVVGATAAYAQMDSQLIALFGPSTAKTLLAAVKNSQQSQGVVATSISVVTLMIGATTVLAALEAVLDQIWNSGASAPSGLRGWIRPRFLSFGFILALGFLLLVSLTLSTGLANLRERFSTHHASLVGIVGAIDITLSLCLVSSLFALIFRYLPARRLPWKSVLVGVFSRLSFSILAAGLSGYI
jgi:membrane protein